MITVLFTLSLIVQSQTNAFDMNENAYKHYTLSLDRMTATIDIKLFGQHLQNQTVETHAIQLQIKSSYPSFKVTNITGIELVSQNNEYFVVVPLQTTQTSKLAILNLSSSPITPKYIDLDDCDEPHYLTTTDQAQIIIGCSNGQIMTINGNTSVDKWTAKKAKIQRFQPFNNEYTKKNTHYLVSSYNMDSIIWQIRIAHYNESHMVINREYKLHSWHHITDKTMTLNSKHLLVTQSESVNVYDITHVIHTEATLTQQVTNHFMRCSSTNTYVQFIEKSNRNDIIVKCYGTSILNLSIVDHSWQISMVNITEYDMYHYGEYGSLISNITAFSIGSRINENGIKQLYLFLLHGQTLTVYTKNKNTIQLVQNDKVQKDIEQIQFISINSQQTLLMAKSIDEIRVFPIKAHMHANDQYKTRQLLQTTTDTNPCADQICPTDDECSIIDPLSGDTITGVCAQTNTNIENHCNICTYTQQTPLNVSQTVQTSAQAIGTVAPPPVYEGYNMISFPDDTRPTHQFFTTVQSPFANNPLTFSTSLLHLRVPTSWATWSHGYQGDVYLTTSQITLTFPLNTAAFIFYIEPFIFAVHPFNVVYSNGAMVTGVNVDGNAGAVGFAVSRDSQTGFPISVTVSSTVPFAIGEFSMSANVNPIECYNEISEWKVDQIGRSSQFIFYDFCNNNQFIKVQMDSLIEYDGTGDSKATKNRINSFAGQDFDFQINEGAGVTYESFAAVEHTFNSTLSVGQGNEKTDVLFTLETIVFYEPNDGNANTLKWSVEIEGWPFEGDEMDDHTLQLCVNIMTNGGDLHIADFEFDTPTTAMYYVSTGAPYEGPVVIVEDMQKRNENHRYFCYKFNWFDIKLVYDPFIRYIGDINESKASFISIVGVMFGFIIAIIIN